MATPFGPGNPLPSTMSVMRTIEHDSKFARTVDAIADAAGDDVGEAILAHDVRIGRRFSEYWTGADLLRSESLRTAEHRISESP